MAVLIGLWGEAFGKKFFFQNFQELVKEWKKLKEPMSSDVVIVLGSMSACGINFKMVLILSLLEIHHDQCYEIGCLSNCWNCMAYNIRVFSIYVDVICHCMDWIIPE